MRLQLAILLLILSLPALAVSDKEINALFMKYDLIMDAHKVELVDEVFTKKFITESGGKKEFISKVKELPKQDQKSLAPAQMSWKKGTQDEIYFAKRIDPNTSKSKEITPTSGTQFILVKEKGKLKIDGTIGDDH